MKGDTPNLSIKKEIPQNSRFHKILLAKSSAHMIPNLSHLFLVTPNTTLFT